MVQKKGRKKGEPCARLSRADTIKTTLICAAQSAPFYLYDAFSRVVRRWWMCVLGGEENGGGEGLTEVGIKGADNGKKGGKKRERERVSMIDRCQAIVKTARMNFTYGFARRKVRVVHLVDRGRFIIASEK